MSNRIQVVVANHEKEVFRKAAEPAVKKLIVEKFGSEGETLMNDFLKAAQ